MAKRIYEGEEITSDRQLLRSTAQDLLKGVQKGYGKREIDWNSPDADMIQNLTENVYQFAAAKNYHELRDMTDAVHDGDKVRSFDEFEKEVKDITGKYNRSWLRSEYNQAIAASQSAARWGDYQRNAKDMPFLQYQCVMDDNTRPEHASLHGIIKRIDDPFWDEFMPPNGWGCRCEAIQLPGSSYEETPDKDIHPAGVPDMFRTNFGKKGIVFPPGHAYYKRFPKEYEQQAKTMARAEVRRILNNAEQYEALKADPKYKDVAFDYTNGGLKATHIEHNFDKVGGVYEREVMTAGYNSGVAVILQSEKFNEFKVRSTEGTWDGKFFEVAGRETATSNNILSGLKHCAAKRKTKIAIIDLPNGGFDESIAENAISRYKGLEKLNDGQFLKFDKILFIQDEKIVFESIL